MKNRNFFLALFLILSALVLLSCEKKENAAGKGQEQSVVVTTLVIQPKDVPVNFEFVAQTQSSHQVNIQARVSGFLDQRVYVEGEMVEKGQELFIMDKKPYQVQVDAAKAALAMREAALETARLNLNRVKPLAELDALSQRDLDDANGMFLSNSAAVEEAKSGLETALLNLSYCTILSPLKGITSAAEKQDGTYLNVADSQLTTVSALDPIWVNFSLSESQIQNYNEQVEKGLLLPPASKEFQVKVILLNGKVFPHAGKITFTEPYFNSQTGTFLIRASVENPEGVLRPNQYVRAKVEGATRPNAILVPQRAVQQSAKGQFVWLVNEEGKADFRPVTVGDWYGEDWFINEGLAEGEQVIVDGGITLHAGVSVTIKQVL